MRQFSLAAFLIARLPDHLLQSLTENDLHTLIDAMRELAGCAETDAALNRLLQQADLRRSRRPARTYAPHAASPRRIHADEARWPPLGGPQRNA